MNTNSTGSHKRVALVCTNFTMQSAFGLLIIALNSVRLGFKTIVCFTFGGLRMIRPGHVEQLRYYPDEGHLSLVVRHLDAVLVSLRT